MNITKPATADTPVGRVSDRPPLSRIENQGITTVVWPQTAEDDRQINVFNDRTDSGVLILTEPQAWELHRQLAYHLRKDA